MFNIPKKVSDRFVKQTLRFQKILKNASDRDVNEADTVKIVADMLADIFGFDKYTEITSEFAIRNTFCDLAIKVRDDVKYLIEVKAIGINLKENHLRQAVNYGANKGMKWVALTNGLNWEFYNIRLDKSVQYEKVFSFNFLDINPRKAEDKELLFLICREGLNYAVIDEYHEKMQSLNRFVISAILLNESTLNMIRREIRKLTPGLKVDTIEIENILRNEVLKREVFESETAIDAQKKVKKIYSKLTRKKKVVTNNQQ